MCLYCVIFLLLQVEVKWHKNKENKDNDYELQGSGNTVELALVGKDNVTEKVWVEQKPGLFSKDFKVGKWNNFMYNFAKLLKNVPKIFYTQLSKCGKAGCKEEPLAAEEEEQALTFENIFYEWWLMILNKSAFSADPHCHIQATRCMFTGRLDSDPNSTVHISGCPFEEDMDISVMSEKVWGNNNWSFIFLRPRSDHSFPWLFWD